jgi:hypothetical protein
MLTVQGFSVQHTFPLSSLPQLITLANVYCFVPLPSISPSALTVSEIYNNSKIFSHASLQVILKSLFLFILSFRIIFPIGDNPSSRLIESYNAMHSEK